MHAIRFILSLRRVSTRALSGNRPPGAVDALRHREVRLVWLLASIFGLGVLWVAGRSAAGPPSEARAIPSGPDVGRLSSKLLRPAASACQTRRVPLERRV